ncbi:MAG: IS21 family transposase, partial [Acidobacteria bacterium]|nr:IS21 family transposase [Acidobacteriota bacterium]
MASRPGRNRDSSALTFSRSRAPSNILDNLKEAVITPDIYDPLIHPLYRDVLAHYGVVALPFRINDPDRKGKVESGVGHAKKTPLKGLRFESLEEAQEYLDRWEANWADTRIHGTTKRQVSAMFAEEKPALLPLPLEPFRYYQFGERTVHLDGCVEVDLQRTPGLHRPGRESAVGWPARPYPRPPDGAAPCGNISISNAAGIVSSHRNVPHELPRVCISCYGEPSKPARTLAASVALSTIVKAQLPSAVSRAYWPWPKKMGVPAVDKACALALEMGVPEYSFVKHYLEH